MDAIKFLKEKYRMTKKCRICCADCPLSSENNTTGFACSDFQGVHPEIAVSIVEKWSKEHPQETRLSQFLKCYPNAMLREDGVPMQICPWDLGISENAGCSIGNCVDCWNTPIEEE